MNDLLLNNLNQLLTILAWLLIAMGLILLLKQMCSLFSTVLQLWEEWRQKRQLTELNQTQEAPSRQLVRGNLNFETPDIEPALGNVNDQLDELNNLSQEEIEWAYEQGADSIEDVLELVSVNKRTESKG